MFNVLFFFSNTKVGGAETNIVKISNELKNKGFNVFFASFENNGSLVLKNNLDLNYIEIGLFSNTPLQSIKKYNKFLIDNNIDFVSSFGLRVDLFVRIFTHFFNKDVKLISNIRASENWRNFLHTFLDRLTSFKVDLWVSNSISARDTFSKREKIDVLKSRVIYNFVDIQDGFKESNEKLNFLKIGIFANYKISKGHFNLEKICSELDKLNIKYTFYCAGLDYTNGEFEKFVLSKALNDRIKLLGYISDKELFFNSIDVFFLPSYIEGLSTSLLEAMSFGIPVVVSNVDGTPEAVTNDFNGFLRDPNDFEGFAYDLSKIIEPEIRNKFALNSFKVLKDKFNLDNNIEKWISVFSK